MCDITSKIKESVLNEKPFFFAKFGDGEFICAFHGGGYNKNCDGTFYSKKLGNAIRQSFIDIMENRNDENSYVALWEGDE